jgi:hypothetical protein
MRGWRTDSAARHVGIRSTKEDSDRGDLAIAKVARAALWREGTRTTA